MADALEEWCRSYLADSLSAGERIRFESRLASGDAELLSALERAKGNFPKAQVVPPEPKMPRQQQPAPPQPEPPFERPAPKQPQASEVSQPGSLLDNPEQANRARQYLARGSALLAIVALIYASWLQWQVIVTKNKLAASLASTAVEAAEKPAEDRTFVKEFELQRLKAALTADQGRLIQIPADKKSPFKKAFLMVDFSTNRTIAMVRADSLAPGTQLAFWVENRDYDVTLLGAITKLRSDSVYTEFNGEAFVHSRFIEVHIQSGQDFKSANRVARIKLP
jgi:hypothetical protein